jgi:hypothetical protein
MSEWLHHIVFEDPMPLWVLYGIATAIFLAVWSRSRSWVPLAFAGGCVLAGIAVGIVAHAVETDNERVLRSLSVMARAVETGDAESLAERISPQYRNDRFFGKPELVGIVMQALPKIRATANAPAVRLEGGEATVIQQYLLTAAPGQTLPLPKDPTPVTWEGTFAPDSDGEWRLRSVTATEPRHLTPEEASLYLH